MSSRPPDDERFDVPSVWAIEIYTPAHVHRLAGALRELGLSGRGHLDQRSTIDVLARARGSSHGGTWQELDLLVPLDDRASWLPSVKAAALPPGVRAAQGLLYTPSPGLTVLVMHFMLDEHGGAAFERAMRCTYSARGRLVRDGHAIQLAAEVRREALAATRKQTRSACAAWLAERAPGAFAAVAGQLPCAELVLCTKMEPFSARRSPAWTSYEELSGLDGSVGTWSSAAIPGIRMRIGNGWGTGGEGLMTLAGRLSDVLSNPDLAQRGVERDPRWAISQCCHDAVGTTLALFGIYRLIAAFQARLAATRDEVRPMQARPKSTVPTLERVRSELLRDAHDARGAAAETLGLCRFERAFEFNTTDFESRDEWRSGASFLEGLRAALQMSARRLLATERHVRDLLVADSAVMSAVAGLRIQRLQLPIALAALVAAAASLLLALAK